MLCLLLVASNASHAAEPKVERHVAVFAKDGMFGGWPANHGMWIWGDEILVGFSTGIHKSLGPEFHNIDAGGMRHGTTDPKHKEPDPVAITEPIEFTHPEFCMTMRFGTIHGGNSRLYYSYDRGHNWKGPFKVPKFGQPGVMARSDYIVNGPHECHVFLTCSKQNQKEGRVFCGRTTDGGLSWKFLSYVGPEPKGFSIMPSTVRLSSSKLVMTTRRREGFGEKHRRWIDTWRSSDNGESWSFANNAVDDVGEGNPPSMIKLRDGRLCLTYGVRKPPFEMQAKFSSDSGKTWSKPVVLQTNGGGRDMGYPRTLQRPDGKIITLYYFYPSDSPFRRIQATIWDGGTP
jgi:hypothetical protein